MLFSHAQSQIATPSLCCGVLLTLWGLRPTITAHSLYIIPYLWFQIGATHPLFSVLWSLSAPLVSLTSFRDEEVQDGFLLLVFHTIFLLGCCEMLRH